VIRTLSRRIGSAWYRAAEKRALRQGLSELAACSRILILVDPRDQSDPLWVDVITHLEGRWGDCVRVRQLNDSTDQEIRSDWRWSDSVLAVTEPLYLSDYWLETMHSSAERASCKRSCACGIRLSRLYPCAQRGEGTYFPGEGCESQLAGRSIPWTVDLLLISRSLLDWLRISPLGDEFARRLRDALTELAAPCVPADKDCADATLAPVGLGLSGKPLNGHWLVTPPLPGTLAQPVRTLAARMRDPSVTCGSHVSSSMPLTVVVLCTPGNLATLPECIGGIRRNIRHPVDELVMVSPAHEELVGFAESAGCNWLEESQVAPVGKSAITYEVDGFDRSGWLFQQLLKLACDSYTGAEHVLVIDADTILTEPQVFALDGKELLLWGDSFNKPYVDVYERLLGEKIQGCFSFVSHQMLFSRSRLDALRRYLESRHECPWWKAILNETDYSAVSGFSEYETYGHFVLSRFPEQTLCEYYRNYELDEGCLAAFLAGDVVLPQGVRSVSFQAYDRRCAEQRMRN
jgi:hypothetical protein